MVFDECGRVTECKDWDGWCIESVELSNVTVVHPKTAPLNPSSGGLDYNRNGAGWVKNKEAV